MKVTEEIELPDLPKGYVYLGRGGEFKLPDKVEGLIGLLNGSKVGWDIRKGYTGTYPKYFYAAPEDSEVAVLNGKARMTAKKWLKTLPDGYRERALRAFKNKKDASHIKGHLHNNLQQALNESLCWESSDEGVLFWNDCWNAARGNGALPPLPNEKKYWSKPSDFPPVCWIRHKDRSGTGLLVFVGVYSFCTIHYEYDFTEIKDLRWSDSPFDNFEDGKECLVEN